MRAAERPNRTSAAVDRREWKAARRDVLVQCNKCSAKGSGTVNPRRRLVSVNLAADFDRIWRHRGCGGRLEAFDIEADS